MADTKISALTASTTPLAGTEVLPIVQGGTTKQVSVANLTAGRAVSALSLTAATVGAGSGADLNLQSNGTTNTILFSNGTFGVGAASNPLSDKGLFASAQTTNNSLALVSTDDASGGTYIAFRNSAYSAIGTVSRVGTTNAVVYNTTSDHRLKTVTGSVVGQGERIDALKPVDYQWKEGGEQARGFLAHEFQTVYPNSVTGDKDAVDANGNPKYQAMQAATSEVIADLVAEIQSLRQRLAAANL